jgi:hypothetical protein
MSMPLSRAARPTGLDATALAGGVCGLLAAIGPLPSALRALLLATFVVIGPGSALVRWWRDRLADVAVRALVPVSGFAVLTVVLTVSLYLGVWSPRWTLLGLAVATVVVAAVGAQRVRRADLQGGDA